MILENQQLPDLKLLVRATFPAGNVRDASLAWPKTSKNKEALLCPANATPNPRAGKRVKVAAGGLGTSVLPSLGLGSSALGDLWAHKK